MGHAQGPAQPSVPGVGHLTVSRSHLAPLILYVTRLSSYLEGPSFWPAIETI